MRRLLGLTPEEVDPGFGVVNISPAEHLYTILVEEAAAARVGDADQVEGVFSNPRIEPYGPPGATRAAAERGAADGGGLTGAARPGRRLGPGR